MSTRDRAIAELMSLAAARDQALERGNWVTTDACRMAISSLIRVVGENVADQNVLEKLVRTPDRRKSRVVHQKVAVPQTRVARAARAKHVDFVERTVDR